MPVLEALLELSFRLTYRMGSSCSQISGHFENGALTAVIFIFTNEKKL